MQKSTVMNSVGKLQLISTIILLGFIVAIFYHSVLTYLQFGFPFDTFLYLPADRFMDFINLYPIAKDFNPYAHLTNYFPLAYFIYYPFTWLTNPNAGLMIFLTIFCCFICWNANYYLKIIATTLNSNEYMKSIVILCFLSYPTLFCLDRANIDALLFIFIALFVIAFAKKFYILAAFLLSIAIGMKAFPAVFIILFLKEKRYSTAFLCIVFTIVFSLLTISSFKLGISGSLHNIQHSSLKTFQNYIIYDGGLTSSLSLFSLAKVILKYFYIIKTGMLVNDTYRASILAFIPYYTLATICIFALVALYILLVETVFWKQVMLLVAMLALLPIMSGDYRLVFVYTPLFLFMVNPHHEKLDYCYTLLFGLLFIPKNFFILPDTIQYTYQCLTRDPCINVARGGYSFMSLLNVTILIMFVGLIIFSGLSKRTPTVRNKLIHYLMKKKWLVLNNG
ncbi:MAG: glycosyltransferase family 87 protein [Pseudomonadota bacterium]